MPATGHSERPWLDAHLDLAYVAYERSTRTPSLLREPERSVGSLSWRALKDGRVRLCLGTIFTAVGEPEEPCGYKDHDDREGAHLAGVRQLELYEEWEREGHMRIVRSQRDLDASFNEEGPLGVVLLMECADPIRSPDEASWWVDRGISMVGLSWAHGSRYSGGNARAGALNAEGRELVHALDEAGAAHDVSHLSDASVDDLLSCARGPIASSHSNARALLAEDDLAPRHLDSDHATEIAARGGVAGINLFSRFLVEDGRAGVNDVVEHAEELAKSFTRMRIGLGSDIDGGFTPKQLPRDMEGPDRLDPLADALAAAGWSPREVASFQCDAWRGFLAGIPCLAHER